MAKFIRVNLPVNSPKNTLELSNEIIEKDTELGVNTVLTGFVDMAAFAVKVTNAETLHKNGDKRTDTAQKKYLRAAKKFGVAKGQTKNTENTGKWYVIQIRDILLGKNRGTEEDLSEYGFNVVISQTGARRNVKVSMPRLPEDMSDLANDIIEQHTALGVGSPLTAALVDMTAFGTLVTEGDTLLAEWNTAREQAQAFHGQALVILGYGEGQTSDTEGTIYYDIIGVRDRLLQKHQGTEEDLSEYGFDVVISSRLTGPKKGSVITQQVVLPAGQVGNISLNNIAGPQFVAPKLIDYAASGSDGKYYASETDTGLPGAGSFLLVLNGEKIPKTFAQTLTELGFSETKTFMNVQNTGAAEGTYRVTFHY